MLPAAPRIVKSAGVAAADVAAAALVRDIAPAC
jgi:hypothetical protein